jgi:hypothetical protein
MNLEPDEEFTKQVQGKILHGKAKAYKSGCRCAKCTMWKKRLNAKRFT